MMRRGMNWTGRQKKMALLTFLRVELFPGGAPRPQALELGAGPSPRRRRHRSRLASLGAGRDDVDGVCNPVCNGADHTGGTTWHDLARLARGLAVSAR